MYGDPLEHPQQEKYWGNVNCIGERSCYDEGKRAAECLTFDYMREHGMEVGLCIDLVTSMQPPKRSFNPDLMRPVYCTMKALQHLCSLSLALVCSQTKGPG